MLKRCIIAENRKLHASPIWVIFFVLPLISAGYGTFNYLQNLEILTERWYSLWTQHTLFYSMLFFPAMVSAYAAYLWRLEHLGHNWNLIMAAPVRPFALFAAKLLGCCKADVLYTMLCLCAVRGVRAAVCRVQRLAAGEHRFLSGARHFRRSGCGGGAAFAGHADPQLCGADFLRAGRRHCGNADRAARAMPCCGPTA